MKIIKKLNTIYRILKTFVQTFNFSRKYRYTMLSIEFVMNYTSTYPVRIHELADVRLKLAAALFYFVGSCTDLHGHIKHRV